MFFNEMKELMTPGVDINMSIRSLDDGRMLIAVLPKMDGLKDEAKNLLAPLTLTGTPDELDAGFIEVVGRPVQKSAGLLTNMKAFEEQMKKTEADSRQNKQQKGTAGASKPAPKPQSPFEKMMQQVTEFENAGKFNDALTALNNFKKSATPEQVANIDGRKAKILKRQGEAASLFGQPAAAAQPADTAAPAPRPFVPGNPFATAPQTQPNTNPSTN